MHTKHQSKKKLVLSRETIRALSTNDLSAPEVIASVYGGRYDPEDGTFRRAGRVLTNRNGKARRLSTFGSVTRTIQAFLSSEEPEDSEYLEFLAGLATACGKTR